MNLGRIAFGLALGTLFGCIIPTPGLRDPAHRSNTSPLPVSIEVGQTTREDVLLALGEPDWNSPFGGRILYAGAYVDVLIVVAGYFGGGVFPMGHHRILEIDFAENGRVKKVSMSSPAGNVHIDRWYFIPYKSAP